MSVVVIDLDRYQVDLFSRMKKAKKFLKEEIGPHNDDGENFILIEGTKLGVELTEKGKLKIIPYKK